MAHPDFLKETLGFSKRERPAFQHDFNGLKATDFLSFEEPR
jgi:hypothetical protein